MSLKIFLILFCFNLVFGASCKEEDNSVEEDTCPWYWHPTLVWLPTCDSTIFSHYDSERLNFTPDNGLALMRKLNQHCEYAYGINGSRTAFIEKGEHMHFIQQPDGVVIERSSEDMLQVLTHYVIEHKCQDGFYSTVLDKIVVDAARRGYLVLSQQTRTWTLRNTAKYRLTEGSIVVHATGSAYDFEGTPCPLDMNLDVQGYRLDRQKAQEMLKKPSDPYRLFRNPQDLAIFDANGPTNYWIASVPQASLDQIFRELRLTPDVRKITGQPHPLKQTSVTFKKRKTAREALL